MRHVLVQYAAPIPVGHRVEVRWYARVSAGLFGGRDEETAEHQPIVVDLDTGIEYASDHAYEQDGGGKRFSEPIRLAGEPSGEIVEKVTGTVKACRVIHVRRYSELDVQTDLHIET